MAKTSDTVEAPTTEERLANALEALARIQSGNQDVQRAQLKQTAPKSNASHPKISVYNPRGEKDYPMPDLKCEINCPFPLRPNGQHGLDREEVTLFNLTMPGSYTIELNDGSLMPLLITGRVNKATGSVASMRWSGPLDEDTGDPTPLFTTETRQRFPSLRKILRQILGDKSAFQDDEYAEQFGRDDSPALAVMPMQVEVRKVKQFLKAKTPAEQTAAIDAGALPISLGE